MSEKVVLIGQARSEDVLAIECALHQAKVSNPVQWVSTGAELIEYLKGEGNSVERSATSPALVMVDIDLPQCFTALEWIKDNRSREFVDVGVIVTATMSNLHLIREAYARGAHSFLLKPVSVEDLLRLVRAFKRISLESRAELQAVHGAAH